MATRIGVITIPTLITSAAVTSLRDVFLPSSQQAPAVTAPALTDAGLPALTFTVTARRVRGVPLTVPAGRYRLTVVGDPPSASAPGGVMLIQLPAGMTLDEAMAAAEAARDAPPAWFDRSLMPGGVEIGEDGVSESVIDLPPGEWIVAGYAMTTEPTTMTVTGAMPAAPPEPEANAVLAIGERRIDLADGRLRAGRNIVRLDNTGARPHFVTIERVPRGTTAATIEATLRSWAGQATAVAPLAPEEVIHVTSSADQSGDTSMWLSVDLAPGTYVALTIAPDPEVGVPRNLTGLYTLFTVAYP